VGNLVIVLAITVGLITICSVASALFVYLGIRRDNEMSALSFSFLSSGFYDNSILALGAGTAKVESFAGATFYSNSIPSNGA